MPKTAPDKANMAGVSANKAPVPIQTSPMKSLSLLAKSPSIANPLDAIKTDPATNAAAAIIDAVAAASSTAVLGDTK